MNVIKVIPTACLEAYLPDDSITFQVISTNLHTNCPRSLFPFFFLGILGICEPEGRFPPGYVAYVQGLPLKRSALYYERRPEPLVHSCISASVPEGWQVQRRNSCITRGMIGLSLVVCPRLLNHLSFRILLMTCNIQQGRKLCHWAIFPVAVRPELSLLSGFEQTESFNTLECRY